MADLLNPDQCWACSAKKELSMPLCKTHWDELVETPEWKKDGKADPMKTVKAFVAKKKGTP